MDRVVAEIFDLTRSMISRFGPRLPGSKACLDAAAFLRNEWKTACDTASLQHFQQTPGSFYTLPAIIVGSYAAGSILFFLQGKFLFAAFFVYSFGMLFFIHQFLFLGTFFDRFFPKRPGCNVWGTIEPKGEARQTVILGGHHDSTLNCRFLEKHQEWYAFRLILPIAFFTAATAVSAILAIRHLAGPGPLGSPFARISCIGIGIGFLFVLPLLRYNGATGTPGAGDNLMSSILCARIPETISRIHGPLEHTRLIVLSTDGEENGQRGSRIFARHILSHEHTPKVYAVTIDCIYKKSDLAFVKRERNGTVAMSRSLLEKAERLSRENRYGIRTRSIPPGGGGTDAAQFQRAGIESLSIIGISTHLIRKGIVYHTSRDIVENIEPKAVAAVLDFTARFAISLDSEITHSERE
jgi:aminopeptidase YwaD